MLLYSGIAKNLHWEKIFAELSKIRETLVDSWLS